MCNRVSICPPALTQDNIMPARNACGRKGGMTSGNVPDRDKQDAINDSALTPDPSWCDIEPLPISAQKYALFKPPPMFMEQMVADRQNWAKTLISQWFPPLLEP